jgi:two-component system, NarL family, response regulator
MTKPRIRILCVDDHQLIREGVQLIIEREPDMRVVAAARTGEEAVALFREHQPDVTLMDLQLPVMNGLEAIHAIRKENPAARIVVLTMYEGNEHIYRALNAGAATYLLKDTLSSDLIRVVRQVHAGEKPLRPEVQAKLAERAAQPTLTPREVEVISLVGEGRRNKEVAATLHISEETVQVHLRNIFAKLGVSDRAAALTVATKRGIVRPRG